MKKIIDILAVGFLAAGIVFFDSAVREERPYKKAEIAYSALKETVVFEVKAEKPVQPFERRIDFDSLKKINGDIAAWIYIPGTKIDYPVLIGKQDSEYLKKNFRREESELGSVFGFADTSGDFSDAHICLFGHNMRTAQMFGELKKYKETKFAQKHKKLYCYTPGRIAEYELFSVYECEKTDSTFEHKMQKNSEEFFELFHRTIQKNTLKSIEESEIQRNADGKQIITLSCCSEYRRTVNRMTVHFLETNQAEMNQ